MEEMAETLRGRNDEAVGRRLRRRRAPEDVGRREMEGRVERLLEAVRAGGGEPVSPERLGKEGKVLEFFESGRAGRVRPSSSARAASSDSARSPDSARSAPDVLSSLPSRIAALSVDEHVGPIRRALREENEELLESIKMLQEAMERECGRGGEAEREARGGDRPSVEEMRRLEGRLEEEVRGLQPARPARPPQGAKPEVAPLNLRKAPGPPGGGGMKGGRARSKMAQALANAKENEGIEDDDLKFFS